MEFDIHLRQWNSSGKEQQEKQVYMWSRDQASKGSIWQCSIIYPSPKPQRNTHPSSHTDEIRMWSTKANENKETIVGLGVVKQGCSKSWPRNLALFTGHNKGKRISASIVLITARKLSNIDTKNHYSWKTLTLFSFLCAETCLLALLCYRELKLNIFFLEVKGDIKNYSRRARVIAQQSICLVHGCPRTDLGSIPIVP